MPSCAKRPQPAKGKDVFERSSAAELQQFLLVKLANSQPTRAKLCKAARALYDNNVLRKTCAQTVLDHLVHTGEWAYPQEPAQPALDNSLNYSKYGFSNVGNALNASGTPLPSGSLGPIPLWSLAGSALLINTAGTAVTSSNAMGRALLGLGQQYNVAGIALTLAQVCALKYYVGTPEIAGKLNLAGLQSRVQGLLEHHGKNVKDKDLGVLLTALSDQLKTANPADLAGAGDIARQMFGMLVTSAKALREKEAYAEADRARTSYIVTLVNDLMKTDLKDTAKGKELIREAALSLHPVLIVLATAIGSGVASGKASREDLVKFMKGMNTELRANNVRSMGI